MSGAEDRILKANTARSARLEALGYLQGKLL